MIVEIKAMCEANGSVLAAAYYDDSDQQARATAVIGLLEQVLAYSENADDQRLFTLDIGTVASHGAPSSDT
ncbi:hypothetical protein SSBR45G_66830 [Bradyrhizobium sp. SSBR45G]|uniref:hypothetical protein n=1 Tax=unclassified Bradyrhizobium TaxID=2631580 RepID=UPI00234299EA|nr:MULTISPECIES: hypothetical protein [unclassified Bradyrhizobium]GLH81774.1 hypothetical protein SSBR45G_66830 [Bradyrhizobium sp. SSBR45G]GLH85623.1 hypothetical protein SSBR45R_30830 [Bradyrhizobium sp. SSBR45R]